jgi:hypothetical protein
MGFDKGGKWFPDSKEDVHGLWFGVMWFYHRGRTRAEIAKAFGMSPGTVSDRIISYEVTYYDAPFFMTMCRRGGKMVPDRFNGPDGTRFSRVDSKSTRDKVREMISVPDGWDIYCTMERLPASGENFPTFHAIPPYTPFTLQERL